jgi:hypothetical protein
VPSQPRQQAWCSGSSAPFRVEMRPGHPAAANFLERRLNVAASGRRAPSRVDRSCRFVPEQWVAEGVNQQMKGVCWDEPTTQTNDGRVVTAQPFPDYS